MQDALRQDLSAASASPCNPADLRAAPRYTLLIRAAKVIAPEGEFLCVIRDASETGLSARIFHPLPLGRELQIELQNGDRHLANVVWQNEERAGFEFSASADIARILESPSNFSKRPIRLNLSASAELQTAGIVADSTISNISQQGANVACGHRFAIDQQVVLRIGTMHQSPAKVRWRDGGHCGLVFENTLQFGELARIAHQLQQR